MDNDALLNRLESEELVLSTINRRAFAMFIDEIIISFLFFFIIGEKIASFNSPEEAVFYIQSLSVYFLIVKILYQAIFVAMYGATLGKMAMKIKVIDMHYFDIPSWQVSFVRSFMRIVDEILFYIGFVVAIFSPLKLTWHDRIAKTLVVDA